MPASSLHVDLSMRNHLPEGTLPGAERINSPTIARF